MKTVDSKKQELGIPEIIAQYLEQTMTEDDPPIQAQLLATVREGTLEGADVVQIGNTVFFAHRGKGENKYKMVGHSFSVDTGRNFIANCIKYLQYLQDKNITHYHTNLADDELIPAMQMIQKRLKKTEDSAMYIGVTEDDKYLVYVKLGKDPIR